MNQSAFASSLRETLQGVYGDILTMPLLEPGRENKAANQPSEKLATLAKDLAYCQSCNLHIGRSKLVFGHGHWAARIAFIGDFPQLADDEAGRPFAGEDGALLNKMILAMKLRPEETYWANVLKCKPPFGQTLAQDHFLSCEPNLLAQFANIKAPFVVALGEFAAQNLARSEAPLRVLRRQVFSWNERKLVCTHHPRDLLTSPEKKKEAWDDLQLVMREMAAQL